MHARSPTRPLVVLVDDDTALRTALKFSLELDGFEVEAFETAEEVLSQPVLAEVSCLVMDQNLPGLSGVEALYQLRQMGMRTPALLITSNPGPSLRKAAAATNAAIVEKPLLGDVLVGSIIGVLSPEATRALSSPNR